MRLTKWKNNLIFNCVSLYVNSGDTGRINGFCWETKLKVSLFPLQQTVCWILRCSLKAADNYMMSAWGCTLTSRSNQTAAITACKHRLPLWQKTFPWRKFKQLNLFNTLLPAEIFTYYKLWTHQAANFLLLGKLRFAIMKRLWLVMKGLAVLYHT